jgi:adenine C2-methylase RlmN of 23S rRNA A2503 and tRNA A37
MTSLNFRNIRIGQKKFFKTVISTNDIDKFSKTIQDNGFLSLFRRSRGRDINASCGSLANKKAVGNE